MSKFPGPRKHLSPGTPSLCPAPVLAAITPATIPCVHYLFPVGTCYQGCKAGLVILDSHLISRSIARNRKHLEKLWRDRKFMGSCILVGYATNYKVLFMEVNSPNYQKG